MTVSALEAQDHHRPTGPFILTCDYCSWTSQETGIQFDNVVHLSSQLSKIYNKALREPQGSSVNRVQDPTTDLSKPENPDIVFNNLKTFLKSQTQDSTTDNSIFTVSGDIIYNSPSALARIMALYNVGSHGKKADQKHTFMRESSSLEEGLRVNLPTSDFEAISKLRAEGFTSTTSPDQRSEQRHQPCQFTSELRPIPMLLRTKRARRCRTCRHILVKPDPKVESTRYRIRLIASNYIPSIHVKPLQSSAFSSSSPATRLSLEAIPPLQACQFLLSLRNPLFDPVNVTLATPSRTPGRWRHKVTILCPQFEIGANADAWDEALAAGGKDQRSTKRFGDPREEFVGPEGRMAEAGKVWEKGRNWVSVVVEIVCADVHGAEGDDGDEDEDLLEVPVFVRLEWEEDAEKEKGGKDGGREKRELAYWLVFGIGRVGKLSR
ncbi:MAG: hypothetical protein LQ351_006993 [Letrouitia transgressa]|nr:MAG: hypothetical protein LQ351_006993 [Letrouitia transgressa]